MRNWRVSNDPNSPRQKLEGEWVRDFCLSRGLGDVYKRQVMHLIFLVSSRRQA